MKALSIYNLGQNKMEQLSPIPPKSKDEGVKEQKCAILASLKLGGRGGPDVPFILSKIVARMCTVLSLMATPLYWLRLV